MIAPIHITTQQMKIAASLGASIKFVYNCLIGSYREFDIADYTNAIRAVGADHCVLSSDLGQPVNPIHNDGLREYSKGLNAHGLTSYETDLMSKNPQALILGLDPQ